jgi:hypothetical protein
VGIKTECDENRVLEGYVLLKTLGLLVSPYKQECVGVEKVQIVYSFRECMKFMVNTLLCNAGEY